MIEETRGAIEIVMIDVWIETEEIVMIEEWIEIEEIVTPMKEVVQDEKGMRSIDTLDHAKGTTAAHQALKEDHKETKKKSRNQLKLKKSLF